MASSRASRAACVHAHAKGGLGFAGMRDETGLVGAQEFDRLGARRPRRERLRPRGVALRLGGHLRQGGERAAGTRRGREGVHGEVGRLGVLPVGRHRAVGERRPDDDVGRLVEPELRVAVGEARGADEHRHPRVCPRRGRRTAARRAPRLVAAATGAAAAGGAAGDAATDVVAGNGTGAAAAARAARCGSISARISSRPIGPRRYESAQRDLQQQRRRVVDVVQQEHALLEAREQPVQPLPVEALPRSGRDPFESVEHARLVALGLQAAEEPGAGIGQRLVVEVDRILRRRARSPGRTRAPA